MKIEARGPRGQTGEKLQYDSSKYRLDILSTKASAFYSVKLQIVRGEIERRNILNILGLMDFALIPRFCKKEIVWGGWDGSPCWLFDQRELKRDGTHTQEITWRSVCWVQKNSQDLGWWNWIGAFQRRTLNDIWMFEWFWEIPTDHKHCMQCKVYILTHAGGWACYFIETRAEIQAMFLDRSARVPIFYILNPALMPWPQTPPWILELLEGFTWFYHLFYYRYLGL